MLVITGGEPLIHQRTAPFEELLALETSIHIETNGTLAPAPRTTELVEHFSVSPKVNPQGDPQARRIKISALRQFADLASANRACFKIVAASLEDVNGAAQFVDELGIDHSKVWIMPEGVATGSLLSHARAIAPAALSEGFNLSLRQHVLLYGNERLR